MKYQRIWRYVAETPWAITAEKMADLLSVLTFRASGGEFTPDEIRAQISAERAQTSATSTQGTSVAVIPLRGVIAHRMDALEESSGGMSVERFGKMFRAALADPAVGTILIDVDSPGGTVPGVQEMASEMLAARGQKRVVAIANSLMASAAYWLAAAADEIVSIPTGAIGSIGVFSVHEDLSERAKQLGIAITLISAGKYKTEGNPFEPLSEDAKAHIQGRVDEAYEQFVKAVAKGRGVTPAAVRGGYGEGRVLGAKDALAAGLIDRIATYDETVSRLVGRRSTVGTRADADVMPIVADADADRLRRLERF